MTGRAAIDCNAPSSRGAQHLHRVCAVGDIPQLEGRSITVGERVVAVFNTVSGFTALDGICPHRGGPLADGIVADSCVICPLHGWKIDLTTGQVVGGEASTNVFPVVEQDGELFVSLPMDTAAG